MVTKLHCRCGARHGSVETDGSTVLTTGGAIELTRSGSTSLTTRGGLSLGLFLCAVTLVACASVIPDGLRDQARSVPFALLQRAPERYAGTLLILGGEVLALRPWGEWIEVAVLERPLGFRDRPRLDRAPRGRFAVVVRLDEGVDQLDPGRLITVVGEVQGRAGPSGTIPDQSPPGVSGVEPPVVSDTEPLLVARYLHVWPPPLFPGGPNIGFEFGYQGSIGF
ncbi:MAG: hypothetical protein XU15_C0003G0159 [candidate division NC10 bacterium CSP1-5]|nr:MAG: hypothetical protein XU15_C0003G0159 [candidate division NC10 bacterium CSP1-5]